MSHVWLHSGAPSSWIIRAGLRSLTWRAHSPLEHSTSHVAKDGRHSKIHAVDMVSVHSNAARVSVPQCTAHIMQQQTLLPYSCITAAQWHVHSTCRFGAHVLFWLYSCAAQATPFVTITRCLQAHCFVCSCCRIGLSSQRQTCAMPDKLAYHKH
jgi:hypothetical protein